MTCATGCARVATRAWGGAGSALVGLLLTLGCAAEPEAGSESATVEAATPPSATIVEEVRAGEATAEEPAEAPVEAAPPPRVALVDPRPEAPGAAPEIERPEGLGRFFAALDRVAGGEGVVRVSHMGDSSIGSDDLPHRLRRLFQARYGDAGPGFVLMQAHGPSYRNRAAELRTLVPWSRLCYIITRCAADGHYGLGGARVEGRAGHTALRLRDGRVATSADLYFAALPEGGSLRARFDSAPWQEFDARAEVLEDRFVRVEWPEGARALHLAPSGLVRAYGVVLENDGPGLVWDTLSMMGAFTPRILHHDEPHFAAQLARRDPDLVIVQYGGNDLRRLVGGAVTEAGFAEETRALLARVRAAVPEAGCLLVGINDHSMSGATPIRPRDVDTIVRAQRGAAEATGCAYYSVLDAMGGAGNLREWRRARLAAPDEKHLTSAGRALLAARLHAALEHAHGR